MKARIAAWALAALLAISPVRAEQKLVFLGEDHRPYSWVDKDGSARGQAVETIREMMRRAALPYELSILPWQRVYAQARDQGDTCAFGMTITDKRLGLFKWARPLNFSDISLYALASSNLAVNSIDEVRERGLAIGVELGDITELMLQEAGGLKLDSVPNRQLNVRKLMAGRIDLWAAGPQGAEIARTAEGAQVKPVFKIATIEVAIGCNKAIDDEIIARMQRALNEIRQDGTLDAIWAKNS